MTSKNTQSWLHSMQQGQQKFRQGDFEPAARFYDAATKALPSRVEGWLNLGIAQVENGRPETGLGSLEHARCLNPDIMHTHQAIGDAQRQLGNWDAAITAYQRAVALQKTPMSLNQLAGALRVARDARKSEGLYREALQMDPNFNLARVNLATVQIELQKFSAARKLLSELKNRSLSPLEADEVACTGLALELYFFVKAGLEETLQSGNTDPLQQVLQKVPDSMLGVDPNMLEGISRYAESAKALTQQLEPIDSPMPGEWPLIEALFMIPMVETVTEYRKVKCELTAGLTPIGDLMESVNMVAVARAGRLTEGKLRDPIVAETCLRYWHALATHNIPVISSGHFKMTNNLVGSSTQNRTRPHLVTGTVRKFFSDIYNTCPPGLARGFVCLMAICDIHPFEDANGRIALSMLNRELEWAGLMPVLFSRKLGFGEQLSAGLRAVREANGDVSQLVPLMRKGQRFAKEFCAELAQS